MDIIANNLSAQTAKIYKKITVNGTDIKDYLSGQISTQVGDALNTVSKIDDTIYTELESAPKVDHNIVFVGNREFIYLAADESWHELGNEDANGSVNEDDVLNIISQSPLQTTVTNLQNTVLTLNNNIDAIQNQIKSELESYVDNKIGNIDEILQEIVG